MEREEMIQALKKAGVRAVPTVMTFDMGLQYDYITPEGAGTGFGWMGDWPVYCLRRIELEQWKQIRQKVADATIMEEDFQGTDIGLILAKLHQNYGTMYDEYYGDLAVSFRRIMDLPEQLPESFFCLLDAASWGDEPRFYVDETSAFEDFRYNFCDFIQPWDEMDDDQLENWLNRCEDDLSAMTVYEFH